MNDQKIKEWQAAFASQLDEMKATYLRDRQGMRSALLAAMAILTDLSHVSTPSTEPCPAAVLSPKLGLILQTVEQNAGILSAIGTVGISKLFELFDKCDK